MCDADEKLLLSDSSTLVNFLRIDRLDLLTSLPFRLLVTDVVRNEITRRYQLDRIEEAITAKTFEVVSITDRGDLAKARDLLKLGLGRGESFTIVAAQKLGAITAIDDKTAVKRARRLYGSFPILSTADLIVMNIRQGTLTVEAADGLKELWERAHQFKLMIATFADLL